MPTVYYFCPILEQDFQCKRRHVPKYTGHMAHPKLFSLLSAAFTIVPKIKMVPDLQQDETLLASSSLSVFCNILAKYGMFRKLRLILSLGGSIHSPSLLVLHFHSETMKITKTCFFSSVVSIFFFGVHSDARRHSLLFGKPKAPVLSDDIMCFCPSAQNSCDSEPLHVINCRLGAPSNLY